MGKNHPTESASGGKIPASAGQHEKSGIQAGVFGDKSSRSGDEDEPPTPPPESGGILGPNYPYLNPDAKPDVGPGGLSAKITARVSRDEVPPPRPKK